MEIRMATRADLGELRAVEGAADRLNIEHFGATDWPKPSTGKSRKAAPGFILVAVGPAEQGQRVRGFAHVLQWGTGAHLDQLAVRPEWQRQGIGTALVQAAAREAAARGAHDMTLVTYLDVPWNGPFYARFGFKPTQPRSPVESGALVLEHVLGLHRYGARTLMVAGVTPEGVTRE
jgi:ribosomal protein S18 acetylase RimI-like enzyme